MGIKPFWDTHHIVLQCIITIEKTTIIAAWDRQAAPRLRTCFSHAWAGKFNRFPILQMELLAAPGFRPLHFAIWTFLNHMTTISQGNQPPLHPKPQRDWDFSAARTWHPQFRFACRFWVWLLVETQKNTKLHGLSWFFKLMIKLITRYGMIWPYMTINDLCSRYTIDTIMTMTIMSPIHICHWTYFPNHPLQTKWCPPACQLPTHSIQFCVVTCTFQYILSVVL